MPFLSGGRWIISRRADLWTIILSPWISVAAVLGFFLCTGPLSLEAERTARVFVYLFTVFFDHPHILQTFSRTHFDPVERKRHFATHHFVLGAALVGTFLWPETVGGYWFQAAFDIFGTWHIYAQNAGFLKVYGRLVPVDETLRRSERLLLNLLFNAYLVRVLTVDLSRSLDDFGAGGPEMLSALQILKGILTAGALGAAAFTLGRSIQLARRKEFRWEARNAFLVGLAASYGLNYSIVGIVPVAMMLVADTLYHDVQYLSWIAHYQRRRRPRGGYALKWAIACTAGAFLFFHGEEWTSKVFGKALPLSSVFLTLTVYHYYIDGLIWKFGTQAELKPLLGSGELANRRKPDVVVRQAHG